MGFESHGIHTRLHYVVKGARGIDRKKRLEYIKSTYKVNDDTAELLYGYDIESWIEGKTIEEVIVAIAQKEEAKRVKAEKSVAQLNALVNQVCGTNNMMEAMEMMKLGSLFGRRHW